MFLLLLVVLGWYSGWFVGLMFKRQQNDSTYGKSVTFTERVLCFYCYWLCWFDIAVGLLVWYLKDNRMNRLMVKVWHLLSWFHKRTVARKVFVNYCHCNLHENRRDGSVDDLQSQTDGLMTDCVHHVTLSWFRKNLIILHLRNSEQWFAEN